MVPKQRMHMELNWISKAIHHAKGKVTLEENTTKKREGPDLLLTLVGVEVVRKIQSMATIGRYWKKRI
ncbi:hypothetical protein KFK09_024036 [Dendrobium nobile]|uniref:Uncharacterized protein n=1 Tax=Dendrobium nobile TaxID=94219 RepID=A0A8T3ACQ9_DENNO|nr:hypothetical protein KFK09_024036 [Dendrobium nobile]